MRNKYNKRGSVVWALFWWALAVGWIAVLVWCSGQDGVDSGSLSSSLARALMARMPFLDVSLDTFEHYLRKFAHFGIFALEGFLMRIALYNTRPRTLVNGIIASAICAVLAVSNELHQLTAQGRSCSATDMLIDFSGAFLGILAASLICWIAESIWIRRRYRRLARRRGAMEEMVGRGLEN